MLYLSNVVARLFSLFLLSHLFVELLLLKDSDVVYKGQNYLTTILSMDLFIVSLFLFFKYMGQMLSRLTLME